ncbi:MAG TPA: hypothetical protein VID24_06405 [Candidatus Eremiobacteraceae bacterium]|jgi:hypothetical protein
MRNLILVASLALLVACANRSNPQTQPTAMAQPRGATTNAQPASSEQPLPTESNPPGDIPDTQAFISFVPPSGTYRIDVPEGWARTERGDTVSFTDKFDRESILLTTTYVETAIAFVERHARAGRDFHITKATLPGGPATILTFTANSETDPITDKRVRLEEEAIVFQHKPSIAMVELWAPLGADNVDQWKRIATSFRWR